MRGCFPLPWGGPKVPLSCEGPQGPETPSSSGWGFNGAGTEPSLAFLGSERCDLALLCSGRSSW